MYSPINPKQSFPALEEEVLSFWEENRIFEKSIEQRTGSQDYVLYDGPPFATGLPHFGHFIPSTIKDIIPRYQTMRGKRVERRFGWDCHGLPVENLIEKELGLNSKTDIERYGVTRFNDACRASVLRYVAEWRRIITRLGRWVDFDNDYKTMSAPYMESIWYVVKTLYDRGLIYEGYYILPYCPRCATVLSNHELNLGGYKDVHDPAVTIKFKILEGGSLPPRSKAFGFSATPLNGGAAPVTPPLTYLLAWTTTPWTLPSNLALCVGPDIDYVLIEDSEQSANYILAEARLQSYFKNEADYKILSRFNGCDIAGIQYEPLFPYFADAREKGAFRVYSADFVSTEDGSGIVHTAPGFGEDDERVLKGTGVPTICPVDAECKFTFDVPDYAGRFVKDCDKDIIERLKSEGKLFKRDQILHSYPHCWRCQSPLIYRAVSSWFVNVQKIKDDMIACNKQIHWTPAHIQEGRFGKWLEGARDWAISRNRYWGNPIPIWKCPDCGKTICIGSRAELKELSGVDVVDLHKQFVDEITIPCEKVSGGRGQGSGVSSDALTPDPRHLIPDTCHGTMRRVPEILDCWFESGAMPYSQSHYPFENKELFESHFPADFINEGLDQTRGWFYTLTVLAAALFKRPAFKNCIVSGIALASDGKKMSKSLRNYTDPMEVVNKFGADALRLFLVTSPVVEAENLRYSDEGVSDVLKSIIIPLWNAYSFFVTYANIDGYQGTGDRERGTGNRGQAISSTPRPPAPEPRSPLDKWIISVSQTLVQDVRNALDDYNLSGALKPVLAFIDSLNNWYIRRSRRRFWKSENDADKTEAYTTLLFALKTLVQVACPFMPFTTEAIWRNLRAEDEPISVHLCDFPGSGAALVDTELEFRMAAVRRAVTLGRALRSQYNLKVRQPLSEVTLVTRDKKEREALEGMSEIIAEELNVKEVAFSDDESGIVTYEVKANFRILGKELGAEMKDAASLISRLPPEKLQAIIGGGEASIVLQSGKSVSLTAEKLDIRRLEKENLRVLNEGTLTVALNTEVTPALVLEGLARDIVRGVQNLRKESGFEVSDRIKLTLAGSPQIKAALDKFHDYIAGETLSVETLWSDAPAGMTDLDAGEETAKAKVEKV